MDRPFVLFYSKYCAHSRKIMGLIDDSHLKPKTVKICVDDKSRSSLPATVQAVPTLIDRVSGEVHVGESITMALMSGGQQQRIPSHQMDPRNPTHNPGQANPTHSQFSRDTPASFMEIAAVNQGDGQYAMMSGDAAMNTLDESYRPLSDQLGTSMPSSGSNAKNNGIENKFEQMMAERQKEAMGQQRQRT